ncbi:hypothetical protein EW026_g5577 [Hermanssonia centrifuga]|uniref:ubiquitinyl hydrolase 1 n=1 Tax=Hermanssonia centrifuga TaxID=98765 RepID=A0A4V3XA04_9APHY|nr:hypothetical protein EW026_g5577 [Hermanssonia centrifuga]
MRILNEYILIVYASDIAKNMRRGRQEDSHEFLRYAIDAFQKSCLAGHPPKLDHKLAETTWVHKIFGGQLRSRVKCLSCGYNSDTFDSILDLSIDIYGTQTLKDALRKFIAVDHLKGADKYKCEKCKKYVTADKQFTVHEAPMVLTVHFKRFSPMGRKIGHPIRYEDHLSLQSVMSEGQYGPAYSLYGIISHAGGGPNSGHYYAHVKDAKGRWFEMNDDSVTHSSPPLGQKNAYMLFYIRDKGQSLEAALKRPVSVAPRNIVAGMKRKKVAESDDEEATGTPPVRAVRFIGPLLPSRTDAAQQSPSGKAGVKPSALDPQAAMLKKKIADKRKSISSPKVSAALQSLSQYAEDDDDDDKDGDAREDVGERIDQPSTPTILATKPTSPSTLTPHPTTPNDVAAPSIVSDRIPTESFYGSSTGKLTHRSNIRKRKSLDDDDGDATQAFPLSQTKQPLQSSGTKRQPPW